MDIQTYINQKIEEMPSLAKSYIALGDYIYSTRHEYFRLKMLIDSFLKVRRTQQRWIILYGLRGIGKTTIVMQLYEYLTKSLKIDLSNIIYIAVDDLLTLTTSNIGEALKTYIETVHKTTIPGLRKKLFIFIDEAHFDKDWETAIKSLYDKSPNIFIIVTGSSAISLTLSTDTLRRSIKEPLFPLSFPEYQMFKNNIYPEKGMTQAIRHIILNKDTYNLMNVQQMEKKVQEKFKNKSKDIVKETNRFLESGGFTGIYHLPNVTISKKIIDIINRIVTNDIPQIKNFETSSQNDILRIIGYLAQKKPGQSSCQKLKNALNLSSPTKVAQIFSALESTHLIFSVKPYTSSANSAVKSPWKYYFLSSTILCALRRNLGQPTLEGEDSGSIIETAVAASLFKFTQITTVPMAIYYDTGENNVDFLLRKSLTGEIIPIEVGTNKGTSQIKHAMKKYKSSYGIVISYFEKTTMEENILKIPLSTFLT